MGDVAITERDVRLLKAYKGLIECLEQGLRVKARCDDSGRFCVDIHSAKMTAGFQDKDHLVALENTLKIAARNFSEVAFTPPLENGRTGL